MKPHWRVPELRVATTARPPLLPDPTDPQVEVWLNTDASVCAYGQTIGEENWLHLPGVASFRFGVTDQEVLAIAAHRGVWGNAVADAYRRNALPMALCVLGREVLHASAVITPRGVAAFCAVSETGKSTLACALGLRGMPLWADDAVAFDTAESQARALPLPFKLRLRPTAEAHFGMEVSRRLTTKPQESEPNAEPLPLAALFILERRPAAPEATPRALRLSPARAFNALLPHAYCFSLAAAERKRAMVRNYLDLARRVPVFRLQFHPGMERLSKTADLIEAVLSRESAPATGMPSVPDRSPQSGTAYAWAERLLIS